MQSKEPNRFHKRVTRYAKVSKALAGVSAGMALKRNRQTRAEILRQALGGLKGPVMKVAQLLGSIPDIVPHEYAIELAQLQADAPPMAWPFVKRRMAAELGPNWAKKFKSFDQTAAYAASLGQVHRAMSLDGRRLACKLQYPDMASTVEADLKQLKLILAVFERFDPSLSTKEVQAEIADRMREELNYLQEAKHIRLYHDMLDEVGEIHIPKVIKSLSTNRLLTMTWLEGERFVQAAQKRSLKDRNAVAVNMFHAWYVPFYNFGVIHGDPHMGNYTICSDNSINLLDFGCVRVFRPKLVQAVIWLYEALLHDNADLAVEAYKAWGFSNINKKLVDILNLWAKFIYAPLLEDKTRSIEETNTGLYGRETAIKVYKELRKTNGLAIPREFVFIDRASIGLGSVFLRLKAEVNWHRLFQAMTENFDGARLKMKQEALLKKNGLSV